jgi:hypothetical protein
MKKFYAPFYTSMMIYILEFISWFPYIFVVICSIGTYPVYIDSSYIYRKHELIKLTKKSEKIIHVLFILLHLCINFQRQIPNNEWAVKKKKILTDL